MDQGLKERLVGAAVLVAIAVWLIPWVLDGPEADVEAPGGSLQLPAAEEPMPMRTQTLRLGGTAEASAESVAPSAEPELPPPTTRSRNANAAAGREPPPADEASVAEAESTTAAALHNEASAEPASAPAAVTAAAPAPKAPPKPAPATGDWLVQLGSFSEEANARRLAQQAGTYGHKAQVSSYKAGGRTLYRVRVGPQATRAAADAAASALRAHGISDARVVPAR
jgi:DedD protein